MFRFIQVHFSTKYQQLKSTLNEHLTIEINNNNFTNLSKLNYMFNEKYKSSPMFIVSII